MMAATAVHAAALLALTGTFDSFGATDPGSLPQPSPSATPAGNVVAGENHLELDWLDATGGVTAPGLGESGVDQGDTGSSEPPGPPTCVEEPSNPACESVRVCEPHQGSETGHAWFIHGFGSTSSAGPCTPDEIEGPQVTPGRVLSAFRRIPLPAGKLSVQPPGGKTLVNFDTIFSTDATAFDRTVRLLGHRVDLHITPTAYSWHHGDDTTQTSTWAGKPYERGVPMEDYITHQYLDADVTVAPRVDVTYGARYRVDGGPWRDVTGTVSITGASVQLRIVEAQPVLTG